MKSALQPRENVSTKEKRRSRNKPTRKSGAGHVKPCLPLLNCVMSTRDLLKTLKMAKNKDDIEYATAQAKLSEDEPIRVRYKHGTPLEGGKIAESEPVDLFSSAQDIEKGKDQSASAATGDQTQMQRDVKDMSGTRTDDSSR